MGKTTIITRYIKGKFIQTNERTINTNSIEKKVIVNGSPIALVLWDTAGEEKYHALTPIFFHGADGAIIVYDCTKRESFERAEKWFNELNEFSESNPKIILVGNKIDLPNKVINSDEGQQLAQKYNANFFEISALTGMGISNIFENIASEIYNYKSKVKKEQFEIDSTASSNIKPSKSKKKLVIATGSDRYEKRLNESGSCIC